MGLPLCLLFLKGIIDSNLEQFGIPAASWNESDAKYEAKLYFNADRCHCQCLKI